MMEFKKHDPVYFHTNVTGKDEKVYGYIQHRLAGIYFVIDNAGKEWVQYPEDLYKVKENIKANA